MAAYQPIDPAQLHTFSIAEREHKVSLTGMAGLPIAAASFREWFAALPDYLAVKNLHTAIERIIQARQQQRPVIWAMGAHVIKVGCSPIIIDLIRRGIISAVVMNGATAIHDVEVATLGMTSEEVADTIRDGTFGMVQETPAFFAEATRLAVAQRCGLGEALGKLLSTMQANHVQFSLLAAAYEMGIPATVHVAIGTDTIHMHPNANGAMIGQSCLLDFRLLCSVVRDLAPAQPGAAAGVWFNIGSAVLLPEIFLKAVAVARNLGADLDQLTTFNLDMQRHYRPTQNVIGRPVQPGQGLELIGHHELLLPLLRQALIECWPAGKA
ncbi:MAG: hypothetical protein HJJLKODD_02878 [Phycisphaerae bacterium]|nr:hypothetical protein [Phycisphaerae bacterium]